MDIRANEHVTAQDGYTVSLFSFIIVAAVPPSNCPAGRRKRDDHAATEADDTQPRSQIIPGDTDEREICRAVAGVKDCGGKPFRSLRETSLRLKFREVGAYLPGTGSPVT